MSNILSWFPKRQPTSLICGLDLTYSRATSLLSLAQSLSHSLRSQKSAIQAFQITTGLRTISALKRIQEQHDQIHKSLSTLTAATAVSSQPWLHELSDAQKSMQRKVKVCNQASMSSTLGRNEAARIYWPLIAQTYDVLLDLLASFEQEISIALENKEAWKSSVRKLMHKVHTDTTSHRTSTELYNNKGKAKRVRFDKTVRGKYYHCTDAPCVVMERKEVGKKKHVLCKNKEFFIKLAEDGKESTKRLHKKVRERRKKKKKEREREGNEDGDEDEEVNFEEIVAETRWWIGG